MRTRARRTSPGTARAGGLVWRAPSHGRHAGYDRIVYVHVSFDGQVDAGPWI